MRSLVLLFLLSTFALTFTAETDISGCTVDINSLASSVGGTFNGYYTEWDCTNVLTSYNNYIRNHVTATCRWYWDNHFQMIFSPKNPGDDPWVIHSGMIQPRNSDISSGWRVMGSGYNPASAYLPGWKYWLGEALDTLINSGYIPGYCTPGSIYMGGDINGVARSIGSYYFSYAYYRYTISSWNAPHPIFLWGCGVSINGVGTSGCSSGGQIVSSHINASAPYFKTNDTTGGVFWITPPGSASINVSGQYKIVSFRISPSPGTLRVLKELDPQTVEEGGTVEVTVRFDLPVSSNIVLTDSYPSDFALASSTADVYLINAETNTLVSHTTQSVSPSCSGGTCTFSLNLDNLTSEPLFYMVKYRLTAPSVSSASSYTFPPATVSFRVST